MSWVQSGGLTGAKILVTGGTGLIARPAAEVLARQNEVWALGRFGDPLVRAELESKGILTHIWDLLAPNLDGVPTDFTHVLHAASLKSHEDDYQLQIESNTTAAASLMLHCRDAAAFLYLSSSAVYEDRGPAYIYREEDPVDGVSPNMRALAVQKLSVEAVVRSLANVLGLRSVIGRLSVTYGPSGYGGRPVRCLNEMLNGKPVTQPRGYDNWCSPFHTDDFVRQLPLLWQIAGVPAVIVNLGGDKAVTQRDIITYISEITSTPVTFEEEDDFLFTHALDNEKRLSLIGPCEISWQEGMRRVIESHFPGRFPDIS
jgi:UDP-glucuronate 4-epimerase